MADYNNIMATVNEMGGVSGSAIADAQGAIVASTIESAPAELGNTASQVYSSIGVQIKRMQRGTIRRLVLETEEGITLLSGLAQGELLIIFAKVKDGFNLSQLIEITSRY